MDGEDDGGDGDVGRCKHKALPPKDERKRGAITQDNPHKGECAEMISQKMRAKSTCCQRGAQTNSSLTGRCKSCRAIIPVHRGGAGPWVPREKLPRENRYSMQKGLLRQRAMQRALLPATRNPPDRPKTSQRASRPTTSNSEGHALVPIHHRPSYLQGVHLISFWGPLRGCRGDAETETLQQSNATM